LAGRCWLEDRYLVVWSMVCPLWRFRSSTEGNEFAIDPAIVAYLRAPGGRICPA
jgi:hypothetical protein